MLVQVRRKGKIFRVIKKDARKVIIALFLIKITPLPFSYLTRAQVEVGANDTLALNPIDDMMLCKPSEVKGKNYWTAVQ